MRDQGLYHSTPPTELVVPVSAHLELVDDLAKHCSGTTQRRVLRNHSQVALLAGRLAFFDLRDPMSARACYGAARSRWVRACNAFSNNGWACVPVLWTSPSRARNSL